MPRPPKLRNKIYEKIKNQIRKKRFDEKGRLPCETALLTKYKVSRKTVRSALEQLKKDGLIKSRRGYGYYIAKQIKPIAFVYQGDDDAKAEILGAVRNYLTEKGLRLQLYEFPLNAKRISEIIDIKQISGLIHFSKRPLTVQQLRELAENDVSIVNIRGQVHEKYDTFSSDYASGMVLLLTHLFKCGHRNITYLDNKLDDDIAFQAMRNAYARSMEQFGLQSNIISRNNPFFLSDSEEKTIINGIESSSDPITAFIGSTSYMAVSLLPHLERHGITIPGKVSLAGFGGSKEIAYFLAPYRLQQLLSIKPSCHELGEAAVSKLLERIDGNDSPTQQYFIKPMLVEGDSVINI
jgi:DNA-binding LacI/PurR family transcriptional regulator